MARRVLWRWNAGRFPWGLAMAVDGPPFRVFRVDVVPANDVRLSPWGRQR